MLEKAGVKMSKIAWKCSIYLKNANADIAPAVTSAAGSPHQRSHRHNMLQWHCGSLLSRTKSSQDMVTSLESSDEGLLIGASTAWTELSLGTFGGSKGKCERQKYDLMNGWETGGASCQHKTKLILGWSILVESRLSQSKCRITWRQLIN